MNVYLKAGREELHFWNDKSLFYCDSSGRKVVLCPDCVGDFDVSCGNQINVICQSSEGDIIKYTRAPAGWIKSIILKSRSGTASAFGMRLIISEDNLHFIYGLNHGNEKIVVHQQLPNGKPQVITKLFSEDFFVRRDSSGCIYVICRVTDKFWQQSVYRYGGWSRPEEYADNCIVRDVICTGYKTFCSIKETDEGVFFYNGDAKFEVLGENPSIVKYNDDYLVLSEIDGRIFYTGKNGRNKIISGGAYADFHVRFPDSGEYSVCERCRGSVSQGKARLFLIDKMPTQSASVGESVRVEMTKHTIKLEAQIAELEKRVAALEMEVNLYKPQPVKQAPHPNQP